MLLRKPQHITINDYLDLDTLKDLNKNVLRNVK